jgi:hypothetical protein
MTKSRIIDLAVGSLFTLIVGVVLFVLTGTTPNVPTLSANISADEADFPFSELTWPDDRRSQEIRKTLEQLREKDWASAARISEAILSLDDYRTLRILSRTKCIYQVDVKNDSKAKAANVHIFVPDIAGYQQNSFGAVIRTHAENSFLLGDMLPNETRAVKLYSRNSCLKRFWPNNQIYVSFDGGVASIDFFHDQSALVKFVRKYELLVFMTAWILLLILIFLLPFMFGSRSSPKSDSEPTQSGNGTSTQSANGKSTQSANGKSTQSAIGSSKATKKPKL